MRALRAPWSRRIAALAAVPALLVAAPARADDCADDSDCGYGFACETVVTSVASTGTGATGGTSGKGGAAGTTGAAGSPAPQGGTSSFAGASSFGGISGGAGAGVGGSFATGGTANGGSSFGGNSGTSGTAGVGGTAPPTMCGNRYCEILVESPETCSLDCAYTTVCNPSPCTSSLQCAGGYVCPTSGTAGAGGVGSSGFCGDFLCSAIETISTCPYDCDPSLRRCTPGSRGCFSDADCGAGWRCNYLGGASDEAPATGGAGGGSAGASVGGGAGTGNGGAGALPAGGANGMVAEGTCVPDGMSTGGFGGVGGTSGGTIGNGGSTRGGNGNEGGDDVGQANDDGEVIMTRGCGCSVVGASDHSSFAALVVALGALVSFGRRRVRRTG